VAQTGEYQVKGSTLRTKLAYVQENFGHEAAQRLERSLKARGLQTLLDSAWYPFEAYDDLLKQIANHHFDGRLEALAEVGRDSAQRALTTVYKAFLAKRELDRFLRRLSVLHERFYSRGESIVEVDMDSKRATIRQRGAPTYSEADAYLAQGFYAGAAEQFDLAGVECTWKALDDGLIHTLIWR